VISRWYNSYLLLSIQESLENERHWKRVWNELSEINTVVFLEIFANELNLVKCTASRPPGILILKEYNSQLRKSLWEKLIPNHLNISTQKLDYLADRFHFTPGQMQQAIRYAKSETFQSKWHDDLFVTIQSACREIGSQSMSHLSKKLPLPYTFNDFIVPKEIEDELRLAITWVEQQQKVLQTWGFEKRISFGYGLTALLSGPPGTGKTMAAQVLAKELNLYVYRIDLSQVVSKYIGETEKNLSKIFDEAHASSAILFFDEADALFGKRTEVKDSHDRYANIEIGYLLQRMEDHDGITLLATNRRQDLDEAFVRRFHFILYFPMPNEQDRLRIWKGMFPPGVKISSDVNFGQLARMFEISGGEIRNIVLAAAYMAAEDESPIHMKHLKRSLKRELKKSGQFIDETALKSLE